MLSRSFHETSKALLASVMALITAATLSGQSFTSGSNGSDGALTLTTPGTIDFDPKTFNPPLDPDGDNIYHFASITIGTGVTVKLSGNVLHGPVYWLAQEAVQIDGTVDLDGAPGHAVPTSLADRTLSTPGAGGYAGGLGTFNGTSAATAGNGPGGGPVSCGGTRGTNTSNQFLVPLIGGSGGGGSNCAANTGGGGAGGGALLIASSTSIAVGGTISANGGNGASSSGPGAGGAIRLTAPVISGAGSLRASTAAGGFAGIVRLEAFQQSFSGTLAAGQVYKATPVNTFLPSNLTPPPTVRVVRVGGVEVNPTPTGSFQIPDVTINSSSNVTVDIEAQFVPLGTVVNLKVSSENFADRSATSTPLQGTLEASTATATITFPPGFSQGYVKATWTQ